MSDTFTFGLGCPPPIDGRYVKLGRVPDTSSSRPLEVLYLDDTVTFGDLTLVFQEIT